MRKPGLKNDRLWQAVNILATHEGDVRKRVAVTCRLLMPIHQTELSPVQWKKLRQVLQNASKHSPLKNAAGEVIRDAFDNSWRRARNKTYQKYAGEIFSIWKELNGIS